MTIATLVEETKKMGRTKRRELEGVCLNKGAHRVLVLAVPTGHTITYCGDCLLLFIDDIAVNSTVAD